MGRGDVRRAVRWLFFTLLLLLAYQANAETIPAGAVL